MFYSIHPPAITLLDRFSLILQGLRHYAGVRVNGDRAKAALATLAWLWLGRTLNRFTRLVARVEAGQGAPRPRTRPRTDPPPRPPRKRLPQGFAWLVRLSGHEAAGRGSQLRHLLNQPEMAELLEKAPQAAKLLRPLCQALGITQAEVPILGPPESPSPRPSPKGEGAASSPSPLGEGRGEGLSATQGPPKEPRDLTQAPSQPALASPPVSNRR